MNRYTLNPRVDVLTERVSPTADINTLRDEPMFHRADLKFAMEHGGPLTRAALDKLPPLHGDWVIDSRTHMLMPGHYPAMPGWHCDGVPRTLDWSQGDPKKASQFQPNLAELDPSVMNFAVTVSDKPNGVSLTKYILNSFTVLVEETPSTNIWSQVSNQVESTLELLDWAADDGKIVRFSMTSLHSAQPAFTQGWRWFFRASPGTPANEIRKQTMVYVTHGQGW